MTPTIDAVWKDWDYRCVACGVSADDIHRLGLTRERHEVPSRLGDTVTFEVLAVCSACLRAGAQQQLRARQRLTRFAGDPRQAVLPFATADGGHEGAFP
jgi:hypothetical protein